MWWIVFAPDGVSRFISKISQAVPVDKLGLVLIPSTQETYQFFVLFNCFHNAQNDSSILTPLYFLSWTSGPILKTTVFLGWVYLRNSKIQCQQHLDELRFLWWNFFSWNISRVKHLKEAFDWIWRDSLTFYYVINRYWLTYLFTLYGKNIITKLTCATPYHTIITLSVYFYQAKCLITLHILLFPNYRFLVFCFNNLRNA